MRGEENEAGLQTWAEARAHAIGIAAKWDRETGLGMPGTVGGAPTEFFFAERCLGTSRPIGRLDDRLERGREAGWRFGLEFIAVAGLQ